VQDRQQCTFTRQMTTNDLAGLSFAPRRHCFAPPQISQRPAGKPALLGQS
jgi:hypothetical protein